MVRSFASVAAIASILLIPEVVSARPGDALISTGNDLYVACTSNDLKSFGICLGYLQGVSGGIQADHLIAGVPAPFCPRPQVTLGQMKDIVVTFMQNDPAIRDQHAAGIVEVALAEAFPCTPKK